MNKDKNRQGGIIIIILFIITLGVIAFLLIKSEKFVLHEIFTPKGQTLIPEEDKSIRYASGVLAAISVYREAQALDIEGLEPTELIKELIDVNSVLIAGNVYLAEFLNDDNDIIRSSARGINSGAKMVINANNQTVEKMKNWIDKSTSQADLGNTVKQYLSATQAGWDQIRVSFTVYHKSLRLPSEEEFPTGPVEYAISEEGRDKLLTEIDQVFADVLTEYGDREDKEDTDALLEAVLDFKKAIEPETYEDIRRGKLGLSE